MTLIRQFTGILGVNLSGIAQRSGPALTVVIGVACAVGTMVSMLAMGAGARQQEMGDVRPDRIVVFSTGTESGVDSNIPKDQAATLRDLPGIRRDAAGEPLVVSEVLIPIEVRNRGTGKRLFFPLIGTTANIREFQDELHLTAGRMFHRGLHELIVSNACARRFTGFEPGDRRPLRGSEWTIVGRFDQGKDQECVVFTDVDTILSAFNRNSYGQVRLTLQSASQLDALRRTIAADPTLHVEAHTEREVAERNFRQLNGILDFASYFVGTIMALAATLGAVNSLYAMVDSRRRELATLRAIGFRPAAVVASILCESVLLALPGALLGIVLARLLFDGLAASPFGYSFRLAVTPGLAVIGLAWALAMGLIGGLMPALRASRVPVTDALRAA